MTLMLIVTVVSLAVALVMTIVAWRTIRDERRRFDARVAALAADIHAAPSNNPYAEVVLNEAPHVAVGHLFDRAESTRGDARPRLAAVVGGGALVVAALVAALVLMTSGAQPSASDGQATANQANAAAAPASANTAAVPLELVALGHEREDDRLTVHGVVRNPAGGSRVTHLTAVVLLFNREGGFLTSGRATVETPALGPGAEAPFAITIPGAADVSRYRVSFRTEDRVVPHVDRRS